MLLGALMIFSCGGGEKNSSKIPLINGQQDMDKAMELSTTRLVMLDLYADWCGPCRMLSPTLEAIAEENKDRVSLYKVNVDNQPTIARQFNVSGIPLVVFIKNKQVVNSLTGLNPREAYLQTILDYTR